MAGAVKKVQIVTSGGIRVVRFVPPGTAGSVMVVEIVTSGGVEKVQRAGVGEPCVVQYEAVNYSDFFGS